MTLVTERLILLFDRGIHQCRRIEAAEQALRTVAAGFRVLLGEDVCLAGCEILRELMQRGTPLS